MKLKTRYERIRQERESLSDTNCLANALIEATNNKDFYTKGDIGRAFNKCDKSDYLKCDKDEVLGSLIELNLKI